MSQGDDRTHDDARHPLLPQLLGKGIGERRGELHPLDDQAVAPRLAEPDGGGDDLPKLSEPGLVQVPIHQDRGRQAPDPSGRDHLVALARGDLVVGRRGPLVVLAVHVLGVDRVAGDVGRGPGVARRRLPLPVVVLLLPLVAPRDPLPRLGVGRVFDEGTGALVEI